MNVTNVTDGRKGGTEKDEKRNDSTVRGLPSFSHISSLTVIAKVLS